MKLRLRRPNVRTVMRYAVLFVCMAALNFALPRREPLSFSLLFAALVCHFDPFLCAGGYLLASAPLLSVEATLCCAVQACFFLLLTLLFRREMKLERLAYALIAQLPFVFLYPHAGYGMFPFEIVWQKAVLSLFLVALCPVFESGLYTLLSRAFRCKLSAGELALLSVMWLCTGLGVLGSLGEIAFSFVALSALLFCAVLLAGAGAVPFAVVLSLPLCLMKASLFPLACFAVYACFALLFLPYGKLASALATTLAFLAVQYPQGLYAQGGWTIALTLLSCALPAAVLVCLPEKYLQKLRRVLLFYRERMLPRIAINRNRRAVGEQLYDVSSLFREIESAFVAEEEQGHTGGHILEKLTAQVCAVCPHRNACTRHNARAQLQKLITVGRAKGKVNLIDLPADLASLCRNPAGLLFALNKLLDDYRRMSAEMDAAREGRRLLAEQARGVSDILRDIALEQSGEYTFSAEENALSSALAGAGLLSTEIFLYGEGSGFTASVTLQGKIGGKRLCEIAESALGLPLSLAEKIPLTGESACYILKKRPCFDAAFGVASLPKQGEQASGDTHSILRIDERRFLVALSDGMGSGDGARNVSDRTLSLLESLYKAKMPSDTVLSTVNRLIAFSAEETFSCLDLAAVNLDTGSADVVKIGSPLGFVLSGEELHVLEGESLPIGMLEAVHPATMRVTLNADDFLVFMSDGVTSAFGSTTDLCTYLSALRPLNPQALAEQILSEALGKYDGTAEDDMTVLAVKITKNAA